MVTVMLTGALGNQLFTYAFYRSLTDKGIDVAIDTSWFEQYMKKGIDHYRLNKFNTKININSKSLPSFVYDVRNPIHKVIWKFKIGIFGLLFEKENGVFDEKIYNLENHILVGTWQTEKYFRNVENKLRDELKYIGEWDNKNIRLKEKIMECSNAVSVHVRRGDYIKYSKLFGGVCTDEYYRKAIHYIKNRLNNPTFFCFSDDIEWCMNHFRNEDHMYFVEGNTGNQSHMDLVLMSYCKHHIIANSSYSWWGAWIGTFPDSVIIAPRIWLNGQSTRDIWCDNWIRM